jgi:hypothetical protein
VNSRKLGIVRDGRSKGRPLLYALRPKRQCPFNGPQRQNWSRIVPAHRHGKARQSTCAIQDIAYGNRVLSARLEACAMKTASEYLRLAEVCEREADTARSAENRDVLLTIAVTWRRRAAGAAVERLAGDEDASAALAAK